MDEGAAPQWTYAGVRGIHLALVAALIPCALCHFLRALAGANVVILAIAWLISVLLLLFLLPLDQARYPLGLAPALFRTGPLVLNVGIALFTNRDIFSAAFFSATALLVGLAILLTVGTVIELGPTRGRPKNVETNERRQLATYLLLPLSVFAWLAVVGVIPSLIESLRAAPLFGAAVSFLAWSVNAWSTAQAWFKQSVWGRPEKDVRAEVYEASWKGLTALAFTVAFLATFIEAIWLGLVRST